MILQTPSDPTFHIVILWLVGIIFIALIFFSIVTFTKFFKNKSKVALYLGLNYLMYMGTCFLYQFAHFDAIDKGYKTQLYFSYNTIALVFVVIGTIMMFLFYDELVSVSKKRKRIVIGLGTLISIWIILPFNFNSSGEGFQLVYLSYLLIDLYSFYIFTYLTYEFYKLASHIPKSKKPLNAIASGSLVFSIYYILMSIYGMIQIDALLYIGMSLILIALAFYFIGFIQPNLQTKSGKIESSSNIKIEKSETQPTN